MDNQRPIYSFVAREPESPPATFGRIVKVVVGFGAVVLLLVVVSNFARRPGSAPTASHAPRQQQPLAWQAALIGTHPVPCPFSYKGSRGNGFEHCIAFDLPGSGEWVRRVNTPGNWEMPTVQNLQTRDCTGTVWSMAFGGNHIDESCGYLDYRVTDGRPKTIIEGHNPR